MMLTDAKRRHAVLAAALAAPFALAGPASAQESTVTLRSLDGATALTGQLVEFDGSSYRLRTSLGTLAIDAGQVTCEGAGCPVDELFGAEFGVFGSNTIGDQLMPALIEGYAFSLDADFERELSANNNESTLRIVHPDGREMAAIDLKANGSTGSFQGIATGQAAIGMSARAMRDSDAETLAAAGMLDLRDTPNEHVLALDGLIVITHPDNPIRALSMLDIADIFGGEITNWSEVGGLDLDINVYSRDRASGTFDTFESLVLRPAGLQIAPGAELFEDNALLSDSVANDLAGIGFTGLAYQRAAKTLALRLDCGLVSTATTFSMKTEEYPLSRRLYLYSNPNDDTKHAEDLVNFALSPDAQPLIEEAGFISLTPETRGLAEEGERIIYTMTAEDEFSLGLMQQMLGELRDAERMSVAFRFTPGSSRLDPRSLAEVRRLADAIAAGEFVGREIILAGFTDSIGQFDLNRQLGLRRAAGVRDEIVTMIGEGALSRSPVLVQGYGELTPVGCNDSFAGRFANRRVEVWVREIGIDG
ncbi:MAG: phosphate ABC transporter substrate-binding/OmpA family protein [Pseudomonadota bacterium]